MITHEPATMDINLKKITESSLELPDSGGARVSRLTPTGKFPTYIYDDVHTLVEMMHRGMRISDDGPCIGWRTSKTEYSWLRYSQFLERIQDFGSGLVNIGMLPGQMSFIGIYSKNITEWVLAEHACFHQSAVVVSLYDSLGPDASTFIINQAAIEIVVCDNECKARSLLQKKEKLPSLKQIIVVEELSQELKQLAREKNIQLHHFKDVEELGRVKRRPNKLARPDDVALMLFTSGTTGDPKGAMLTHMNLICVTGAMLLHMGETAPDKTHTMISYLPLAHILEQLCQLSLFINGGKLGFYSGDIATLFDDMKVLKPTYFPAVPRLLNKLYDKAMAKVNAELKKITMKIDMMDGFEKLAAKNKDVQYQSFHDSLGGELRLVITGAAPISETVLNFYRLGLGCSVIELYGQTECSGPCTMNIVSDTCSGNVGAPLPCCTIKLMDVPEMGYSAEKKQGEVCIKGPSLFKGYYRNPAKMKEAIDEEGWLHTGDIGMWTPTGTLKIIDRRKNIFKLQQGEFVAPERIENIYLNSQYVAQVFVYGDTMKNFLVAIVVPDSEVVLPWCKENALEDTWENVCKSPVVKQLIFDDMKRIGKSSGLNSLEQVKNIHLYSEPMSLEGGQLTPTSKTRREVCKKFFSEEIHQMYRALDTQL